MRPGICVVIALVAWIIGHDPAGAADPTAPGDQAAAPGSPSSAQGVPPVLLCRGNEPFWSLHLDGVLASFERLGRPAETLRGARADAAWARPPFAVWRGRPPKAAADLVALLSAEHCRDTMADVIYPLRSIVSTAGGQMLTGCCRAATRLVTEDTREPPNPTGRLGWWEMIPAITGAVDVCITAVEEARAVVGVQRNAEGGLTIRLASGEGGYIRCQLGPSLDLRDITEFPDGKIWQPGDTRILFTPSPVDPPAGGCYVHERVIDENGTLLGWVSRDTC